MGYKGGKERPLGARRRRNLLSEASLVVQVELCPPKDKLESAGYGPIW